MGIVLGLLAALFWGGADFFVRFASKRVGSYRTLLFMQFFGLLGLGIFLLVSGQLQVVLVRNAWEIWLWALLAASLNTLSSLALYRAFEIGVVMIASPISACYSAVTALLAFASGERIGLVPLLGMGVVLLGVTVVATPLSAQEPEERAALALKSRGKLPPGVLLAILASIGYGIAFWMLGFKVTPALGPVVPIWIFRLFTPVVLTLCAPISRQRLTWPRGSVWWLLAVIGILDTIAYFAYTYGVTLSQVSLVSVLSSLYSAVTVLLAWIFIRERLQWSQWLGIGAILAGIALVNL
jgi:drug/metabolite transporter (DMT)-like permease